MMFKSSQLVTQYLGCSFTALVLLAGGVHAQTGQGADPLQTPPVTPGMAQPMLQGRGGSSYQPGAAYQTPAPGGPRNASDKVTRVKAQENHLRRMMSSFGVTEQDIQSAIIVYVQDEVQLRKPLRDQGLKLYKALRDETLTPTDLEKLVADFRAVVEADKVRRTTAEEALQVQIGYKTNPRLEAMLLLFGIIGDGPTAMALPAPSSGSRPQKAPRTDDTPAPTPDGDEGAGAPPNLTTPTDDGVVQPVQGEPALGFTEAQRLALLDQFDFNRDGELDAQERNEARDFLAREYLDRRLWPPNLKNKTAQANKNVNNNSKDNGNDGGGSVVPRLPGPLPVIPAQAITQSSPPPAN